ncbi:creatininase family protein [Calditrichota bacterium LG25]
MNQPFDLTQINLSMAQENQYEVAVLPIGAIEAHNRHLPYGQDFFHTSEVARRCVRQAWEATQKVLLLPALPYGVDSNLMDFPLVMHVRQSTLDALVHDLALSLVHHGIKKMVLLNGHGGNDFKPLIRQLQFEQPLHLFLINWWQVGSDRYHEIFEKVDDHAGELETSVALHLFPELVQTKNAGNGQARPFRFEALNKGWAYTSRQFSKLNDHCAVGDPSKASAEKGEQYLQVICQRITEFLIELANSPLDEDFPYQNRESMGNR